VGSLSSKFLPQEDFRNMEVEENKVLKLLEKSNFLSDYHSCGNNVDTEGPFISLFLLPVTVPVPVPLCSPA